MSDPKLSPRYFQKEAYDCIAKLTDENAALRAEVERQKAIVVDMRKLNSKVIAEREALRGVLAEYVVIENIYTPTCPCARCLKRAALEDRARAMLAEGK
jgi:hypothetical protein